jgi:hypothetical protein
MTLIQLDLQRTVSLTYGATLQLAFIVQQQ